MTAILFYGVTLKRKEYLSLGSRELLSDLVDIWGDDLYVSKGLFIETNKALNALPGILEYQELVADIEWITPDALPEDGNYII